MNCMMVGWWERRLRFWTRQHMRYYIIHKSLNRGSKYFIGMWRKNQLFQVVQKLLQHSSCYFEQVQEFIKSIKSQIYNPTKFQTIPFISLTQTSLFSPEYLPPTMHLPTNRTILIYTQYFIVPYNLIMKTQLLFFLLSAILINCARIDVAAMPNDGSTFDLFQSNPHIEAYRALIIQENIRMVEEHNADPTQTYKMKAYSMFVGLKLEQAKAKYFSTMVQANFKEVKLEGKMTPTVDQQSLKAVVNVDISQRYVTPVYNQGACGNCYAYATTGSIDLVNRRNYGNSIPILSPQDMTDCSTQIGVSGYRNLGCNGGNLYVTIEYARIYGINSLANYPISGETFYNRVVQPCRSIGPKYRIRNWAYYGDYNCFTRINTLQSGYASSIAVTGGNTNFMYYGGGILSGCWTNVLDHAVVLVGVNYNSNNLGGSFFKLKNSWGYGWGESGFIRVSIGQCGTCSEGVLALQ